MPRKQYTIHYIYKTTNIITGKFYIGMHSTFSLEDSYLGSGKRLWYSINKYGKENHKKEILEFCRDRIELKKREEEIVTEDFIKDNMCMNLMKGGKGGYHKNCWGGKKGRSKGGKKTGKINGKINGKKAWLTKIKNGTHYLPSFLNKNHSINTIKKMKISAKDKHIGSLNSQYGTIWITNGIENKKFNKNIKIPTGWEKGRINVIKQKQFGKLNSQYGTCWITNNIENKKINKKELNEYIKNGWIKGRKMNMPT